MLKHYPRRIAGFVRRCRRLLLAVASILAAAVPLHAQVATVQVTFDVTLPANTPADDTIYVAGNFQNWNPNGTPLTRDSATHAHGTVTVPQGSAMEFKFTRGAWSNVEKGAECNELPDRTATASQNMTVTVTVENWADVCIPFYDSRAQKIRLEETVLGVPKEFYIYTPPGYAQATGRRYPALYLFRGHEKEWINKYEDGSRGGRNVIDVYEELLAAGSIGPMILVFPGISSDNNAVPGMATNFKEPHRTTAAGVGNGRFEDYLLQDVIGYVDANFRTVASKAGRGVDGFSLGGFMSVKIAAQHPELFSTVGAFDGTHFYANADCGQVDAVRDINTFTTNSMFDPVFGVPRDTAFAALNNGPNLVCNSTPAAMQSLRWFVQFGPLSGEPASSNYLRGAHLMEKLTAKGVVNRVPEVLEGGHNWRTADQHMRVTLPLHWEVLGPASVVPLQVTAITRSDGNAPTVRGEGVPLAEYSVEGAATLHQPFQPIGTIAADLLGRLEFTDAAAAQLDSRFYRFVAPGSRNRAAAK
jgi:enterochelin esterase-like enzyme